MKFLKGKNKLIACSLAVTLAVSVVGVSFVNNKNQVKADSKPEEKCTYRELLPTMEKLAEEYAEVFAEKKLNEDVETKEVTPIYDAGKNIVGYSVALEKGNTSYGYVNVDYTSDGLVTDFSLQKDTRSMYEALTDEFAESNSKVDEEDCTNKLYNASGMDYAVSAVEDNEEVFYYDATTYEDEDFDKVLDNYAENYLDYYDNIEYEDNFTRGDMDGGDDEMLQGPIKDFFLKWLKKLAPSLYNKYFGSGDYVAPTPYPKHSDVFIYEKEAMGELNAPVMLDVYSLEKSCISQRTIMTTTNRYACALVAVTEICQQENMMLENDLKTTFDKLWDIGGCQENIYETSTFYGSYTVDCSSTYSNDLGRILREYGKLVGKDVTSTYKRNVNFNVFKESIDGQHSTVLGYQIKNEGGHGVNVVGYCQGKIGDNELNYLVAANGWDDDAPRYVLYDRYLFDSTGCTSFTIKDAQ